MSWKKCGGGAAVDLKDRSCRKEVGNPVVTSVDVQATEGLIRNTTVYVRSKGLCKPRGLVP